jgi:hypothetical protein
MNSNQIQSFNRSFMARIKFLLLAAIIMCLSCAGKPPDWGNWRFIGEKWVAFGVDHDVIVVGNTAGELSQLKIRVTSGPLKLYDMKVYFDNGGVQDISIRANIPQGGESRVIDLNGGVRRLQKIEFWYETKGLRKGRARVAVWGRR